MSSLLFPPVVVELQAGLITSEECMRLRDSDCVVGVQCGKPPEVLAKTLKRRGFDTESRFLSGTQANTLIIHFPVLCCAVEHGCK